MALTYDAGQSGSSIAFRNPISSASLPITWTLTDELAWRLVESKLEHLGFTEPNWDSYGAEAPTSAAIAGAKRVLTQFFVSPIMRTLSPSVEINAHPDPTGGVEIEWAPIGSPHRLSVFIDDLGKLGGYFLSGETESVPFEKEGKIRSTPDILRLLAVYLKLDA